MTACTQTSHQRDAVVLAEVEVEQGRAITVVSYFFEGIVDVRRPVHIVAEQTKQTLHGLSKHGIVFNQKNTRTLIIHTQVQHDMRQRIQILLASLLLTPFSSAQKCQHREDDQ